MSTTTIDPPTAVAEIALTRLRPHPKNPRHDVDDTLVASIREQGVLLPIVIAPPIGSDAAHVIIDGHRRVAGAKAAGLDQVPFTLREDLDTPAKQLAAMLVANGDRVDLTVREEAEAFQQLLDYGMSVTKAAKATGRKASQVKQLAAVAALPDKVLAKAHSGQVSLDDAAALAEFVGTDHYADLEKYIGDPGNFAWALRRARERVEKAQVREAVHAYAVEHGWPVVTERTEYGAVLLRSWDVTTVAAVPSALGQWPDEVVLYLPDSGDMWMVCGLPGGDVDDDSDDDDADENPDAAARREQWERDQQEREQRRADLDTAAAVRQDWINGRVQNLLASSFDHTKVLHLVVDDLLQNTDWTDESLRLAGYPLGADEKGYDLDIAVLLQWASGLNQNQLWKVLLVLLFDLGRVGGHWEDAHKPSIRVAMALGYEPSDVERALITPEVKA